MSQARVYVFSRAVKTHIPGFPNEYVVGFRVLHEEDFNGDRVLRQRVHNAIRATAEACDLEWKESRAVTIDLTSNATIKQSTMAALRPVVEQVLRDNRDERNKPTSERDTNEAMQRLSSRLSAKLGIPADIEGGPDAGQRASAEPKAGERMGKPPVAARYVERLRSRYDLSSEERFAMANEMARLLSENDGRQEATVRHMQVLRDSLDWAEKDPAVAAALRPSLQRLADFLDQKGQAAVTAGGQPTVPGFVLAFPGATQVERDELIATLRTGGNSVYLVGDLSAAPVLREVAEAAGMEPQDLQP
jgi:hypothetical protein